MWKPTKLAELVAAASSAQSGGGRVTSAQAGASLQQQASEAEKKQRQMVKLREQLERGRLPYERNLHLTDFSIDTELGHLRRNIIESMDALKSSDTAFRDMALKRQRETKEFLDVDRAMPTTLDPKQFAAKLLVAAHDEFERMRDQLEEQRKEKEKWMTAERNLLLKKMESIKADYLDRAVLHKNGAVKFQQHFSDMFGRVAHVDLVKTNAKQSVYLVVTQEGTVETLVVYEDASSNTQQQQHPKQEQKQEEHPPPASLTPSKLLYKPTAEASPLNHEDHVVDFAEIPMIATGETITSVALLRRYSRIREVVQDPEEDEDEEDLSVENDPLAPVKESSSNQLDGSIPTASLQDVISNSNSQRTQDVTSISTSQRRQEAPTLVEETSMYYFLGLSSGYFLIVEVMVAEVVGSGMLRLAVDAENTSKSILSKQPLKLVYFNRAKSLFHAVVSDTTDALYVAEYRFEDKAAQTIDDENVYDDPCKPSPKLPSSPEVKPPVVSDMSILENWKCSLDTFDKHIAPTLSAWYMASVKQTSNGNNTNSSGSTTTATNKNAAAAAAQGPIIVTKVPFHILGETKRIQVSPKLSTRLLATLDPNNNKTRKEGNVGKQVPVVLDGNALQDRIRVTALAYQEEQKTLFVAVRSRFYPQLAIVLSVSKPTENGFETSLGGSAAYGDFLSQQQQKGESVVDVGILFGCTLTGDRLTPRKKFQEEDFHLHLVDQIEREPISFSITSLHVFRNSQTGHPSVMVGCSDRSARVVSVHPRTAGEQADLFFASMDPMESRVTAKTLRLSRTVELLMAYTTTGSLILSQSGYSDTNYETRILQSSYDKNKPPPPADQLHQIHIFENGKFAVVAGAEWTLVDPSGLLSWFDYRNLNRHAHKEIHHTWERLLEETRGQRNARLEELQKQFSKMEAVEGKK